MPTSRRKALAMIGGSVAAAGLLPRLGSAATRDPLAGMLPGLELYPLNEELSKDFEGTLRKVVEMGFRKVEFPSFYGKTSAQIRATLDTLGLQCPSAGALPNPLAPGMPSLETHADAIFSAFATLGAKHCIVLLPPLRPGVKFEEKLLDSMGADAWKAGADLLNGWGAIARKHGMRLAYHNHYWEFATIGKSNGFELLIANTDPALVDIEMDCAFVAATGHDPAALLRKHRDRIKYLHLKDIATLKQPGKQIDTIAVGQGIIDWKPVFAEMHRSAIEQYYVELEPPFKQPVFTQLADSLRFVTSHLAAAA